MQLDTAAPPDPRGDAGGTLTPPLVIATTWDGPAGGGHPGAR